ncbi:hypothetical protein AAC387_Pa01g4368 [Persea americana]
MPQPTTLSAVDHGRIQRCRNRSPIKSVIPIPHLRFSYRNRSGRKNEKREREKSREEDEESPLRRPLLSLSRVFDGLLEVSKLLRDWVLYKEKKRKRTMMMHLMKSSADHHLPPL